MTGYQPGYCNIGRSQRRRRLRVAGAAFGGAGLYVLAYLWGPLPSPLLLAVFVPLVVGFEWGLQAYTGFCVRLALLNRYDFSRERDGDTGEVTAPDARRADQLQAAIITGAAVVFAAATTVVVVFLV